MPPSPAPATLWAGITDPADPAPGSVDNDRRRLQGDDVPTTAPGPTRYMRDRAGRRLAETGTWWQGCDPALTRT